MIVQAIIPKLLDEKNLSLVIIMNHELEVYKKRISQKQLIFDKSKKIQ